MQPGPIQPTLLTPGVLGVDCARAAWRRTEREYLNNAMPIELRVGLLCAAWEGPKSPSSIHATGMSLLGHEDTPVDLDRIWQSLLSEPGTRRLAAVTRHVVLGTGVPDKVLRETLDDLGTWRNAWQELVSFAAWAESLHRTHLSQIAPLDDDRLDAWLGQLIRAGARNVQLTRLSADN